MSAGKHTYLVCLLKHFASSGFYLRKRIGMSLVRTSSRITDCHRSVTGISIFQHLLKLIPVLRCQYCHVRHMGQICHIIDSLMRLSILSDQSGTVDRKYHMQLLQTHIMQNLIIRPLQKRRIYCHNRHKPCRRHTCRERYSVLFRNSDIEESIRICFLIPG